MQTIVCSVTAAGIQKERTNMKMVHRVDGDVAVITLTGEFDGFAATPFLALVDRILQTTPRIVVNARLLMFMNAQAMGAIIKTRKQARTAGGGLVFSEASRRILDTLATMGLSSIVTNFPSDGEAAEHLRSMSGGVPDQRT